MGAGRGKTNFADCGRVAALALALLGTAGVHPARAQSAATDAVYSPVTDPLAEIVARALDAAQTAQLFAPALSFTAPDDGSGRALGLNGSLYLPAGAASPLVDQKLSYADNGLSLKLGYRNVDKSLTDTDLLSYRTGKDASLPDALNQLLQQRGKSDLNAQFGLDDAHGAKIGYQYDALTDAISGKRTTGQTLSVERDFTSASVFSFAHALKASGALSGGAQTSTTDELKYSLAPKPGGFAFDGDGSWNSGGGKDGSQWKFAMADGGKGLHLSSQFWASDARSGSSNPDERHRGQRLQLDSQMASGVTFTGFLNHELVTTSQSSVHDEFDAILKDSQIRNLEFIAEFVKKQNEQAKADEAAGTKRRLQMTWRMPRFIGVQSAQWVVGFTDQIIEDQALRRDISIGFESPLPGGARLPAGLAGTTLSLEYAGNAISPAQSGSGKAIAGRSRHSRLLRLVSAPQSGKWLSWSVSQQTRMDDRGATLPAARDFEMKAALSPAVALAYSDVDQLPQGDGARDAKEKKLSVTVSRPHSAQMVAEFVHGAALADHISNHDSVLLGFSGPVASNQSLDVSVGRDARTAVGGSPVMGTTCKAAYDWRQDAKNLLGLNGTVTAWDRQGDIKPASLEAEAHLHFERVY